MTDKEEAGVEEEKLGRALLWREWEQESKVCKQQERGLLPSSASLLGKEEGKIPAEPEKALG